MDDHLALREELGVRTADARLLDLLVIAPIVDRDNVDGLAHASSYRPQDGLLKPASTSQMKGSSD